MKMPFSLPVRALALLVCAAPLASAQTGHWEKIAGDSGRTVEIDFSGIFDSGPGVKVSWGRVVLNDSETKRAGYRTIKALNRYGCLDRSFMTVKRVYLDDHDNILREETIPTQTPVTVRRHSADERIWSKVCGLPSLPEQDRKNNPAHTIGQAAAAADQAIRDALRPASGYVKAEVAPPPPKAMLLPAPIATVEAAPQKAALTPPPDAAPPEKGKEAATVPAVPASAALPHLEYIPMPYHGGAAATPASSFTPKLPMDVSQAQSPSAAPGTQRKPAMPFVLPAPSTARNTPVKPVPPAHAATPAHSSKKWGYSGPEGPEFWGKLHPEWKLCGNGGRQSPIDFASSKPIPVDLDPVKFDYRPARFVITHSNLLLWIKVDEVMGMEVRGQQYVLEGFTLHRPGETRIDGKTADMEAHFFHRNGNGRIAVLAVQFMRGDPGSAPLQTLLNNLPLEKGDSYTPQAMLDLSAFLPKNPAHYLYMGSLTTPPCSEGVLWVVMKEAMTLSDEQYEIISRLHAGNARPPQPANARLILESR